MWPVTRDEIGDALVGRTAAVDHGRAFAAPNCVSQSGHLQVAVS
jgi:hypothetical protein